MNGLFGIWTRCISPRRRDNPRNLDQVQGMKRQLQEKRCGMKRQQSWKHWCKYTYIYIYEIAGFFHIISCLRKIDDTQQKSICTVLSLVYTKPATGFVFWALLNESPHGFLLNEFCLDFKRPKLWVVLPFRTWLVVSTHLKNISQNGNLPQIGMKMKNIWNHHRGKHGTPNNGQQTNYEIIISNPDAPCYRMFTYMFPWNVAIIHLM